MSPAAVIGYGGLWLMVDEAHVTSVAVHPQFRGQGLGELLMLSLMEVALRLDARFVTLEVRVSNAVARKLYEKLGFRQAGIRPRYYTDNNEDAVVMWSDEVRAPPFRERLAERQRALAGRLTWTRSQPMLRIRDVPPGAALRPEFSLEALARVVPPAAVEAVVEACGVRERRRRKLPAALTVFFCIAMNLYATDALGHVVARLVSGLRWRWPRPDAWRVSPGALCHARARVGARPLAALFRRVCRPLATPATPGAFLGRWRLMALDGKKLDVPDTPANARAFGRPGGLARARAPGPRCRSWP